ncbi:uncharacterized protein isoform X1 [Choristoneura fumiferana]|uniref:uncharacterized protein isoform X1 n=1 Tax=Choristoneura fumiferana TaxID=7141 RepID=UPI003D15E571
MSFSAFGVISVLLIAVGTIACLDREDYVENVELRRGYKLKYKAETWMDAKKSCKDENGKLAVPKSEAEFNAIQSVVRSMVFPDITGWTGSCYLVWIGISNLDDYRVWRNVDGEDIESTGFSSFAKGNGSKHSNDRREPHCAAVDAVNLLRSFWCHQKQPYVCEYVLIDVNVQ